MEKLKAIRGGHRSAVTRLINRTEEKITENDISNRELNAAVESLEKKADILQNLDNQIVDLTEPSEIEQEILDTDDFTSHMEMKIRTYKDMINDCTQNQKQSVSRISASISQPSTSQALDSNQNRQNSDVDQPSYSTNFSETPSSEYPSNPSNFYHRLPKLELPSFSGSVTEWQPFWESFETTVHTNPSLTNIQRFSYLKSQVTHKAEQCIAGLSLTNANYNQAIYLLKERFGQDQQIIDAYMKNLLELPSPSLSPSSLRHFYDKMETNIRGLESLGQTQDTFGALLVPIIIGKLPTEMRKNMTREHGQRSWDIRTLREAIGKETYVQESEIFNEYENVTPTASFSTVAKSSNKRHHNRFNQARHNKPKPCVFCNESHSANDCKMVLACENRYAIIKQKKLCYNCFGNHRVSECTSKYLCRKCNRKHHTSLCKNPRQTGNTHQGETSAANAATVNTVNGIENDQPATTLYSSMHSRTDVLLKTAISPVWSGGLSASANILLDEGSQKTFVTQQLATQLKLKPSGTSNINLAAFGDESRNVRIS